jgi:hypothetical protein
MPKLKPKKKPRAPVTYTFEFGDHGLVFIEGSDGSRAWMPESVFRTLRDGAEA